MLRPHTQPYISAAPALNENGSSAAPFPGWSQSRTHADKHCIGEAHHMLVANDRDLGNGRKRNGNGSDFRRRTLPPPRSGEAERQLGARLRLGMIFWRNPMSSLCCLDKKFERT